MWKENWDETRARFERWWNHEGLLLGSWGTGLPRPEGSRETALLPRDPGTERGRKTDPAWVAARTRASMAAKVWPGDMLPAAWPDIGTVCTAAYLGAIPEYGPDNIWYKPCIDDPDSSAPLAFDPGHPEVVRLESVVRAAVAAAGGTAGAMMTGAATAGAAAGPGPADYLVGMPALIPNMDVLAELRGTGELLFDLIDRPEWVHARLDEIDEVWMAAYDRMRGIIADPEGGMAFAYFMLWGRGRVGLLQCDVSATFSPAMFDEFVLPRLAKECAFLDRSMYHLDGHQCICHLDSVLSIAELDAVEWTPDPQVPSGGSPEWYGMYRKILGAGKSLWVANARPCEVAPLLDAIGTAGVYLTVDVGNAGEYDEAYTEAYSVSYAAAHAEAAKIAGRYNASQGGGA